MINQFLNQVGGWARVTWFGSSDTNDLQKIIQYNIFVLLCFAFHDKELTKSKQGTKFPDKHPNFIVRGQFQKADG